MTKEDFTQLELHTPTNAERETVWKFYAKPYILGSDVDLSELAVKFLFTPRVEFQFPDAETRKVLWTTTIPKSTPLAEDVDIDFLAERFEFVGGSIKNCILNAAFLAAADPETEGEVQMKHYHQAIKYEFVRTGKVFTRADFEPYASMVL